jgi:CheY-like chemotaxis protein
LFSAAAEIKLLKLECIFSDDLPEYIMVDPLRFRQILSNLIGNAIKFTNQGLITLSAKRDSESESGCDNLMIEISDSGKGVKNSEKSRIFDAFTQANYSIYTPDSGTGLGLAISKQLIELMNGGIGVKDNLENGATFWIHLPIIETDQIPEPANNRTLVQPDNKYTGLHILVADDNAINRKLITTLLGQRGITITEANDGKCALDLALNNDFDLIFMDIRMPELNGIEVTEVLRSRRGVKHTPIIALTAHALPHEHKTFIDAGMDTCITKPVLDHQLFELIDQWALNIQS